MYKNKLDTYVSTKRAKHKKRKDNFRLQLPAIL